MCQPTRINRIRHRIAELAVGLATELEGRGHADLVTEFAHPLVLSVAGELVGEQDDCAKDDLLDTPRDTITGTVYSMVSEGMWASAVADRSLIADAVEETLRRATGPGSHACAGADLARTEARLAVEVLTRRLPDLALAAGHEPSRGGLDSLAVTWPVR